jgi:hypothetical protein
VLALKTNVKNQEVILKKLHPTWALLQAAEIAGTFTTGGTGICSFCMFQQARKVTLP